MTPLVILGAGGFARETLDIVEAINDASPTWEMLGYIVDSQYGRVGEVINDKPILGDLTWLDRHPNVTVVCGIGAPELKYKMIKRTENIGVRFSTVIHPSVIRTRWTKFGEGVVVAAGCVLSNNITVLDHVHLNPSCTIGHDTYLGAYATLAPGVLISGNVHLYDGAYIGTGAKIIQKKSVGEWSIVGAGCAVIRDVPPNTTVVGVPGKVIKERSNGWHLL